ncbi:zinc finger protein 431-like isoform X2 [Armigeres subalbatus]|uniref:zinc finger protein 431-like isoform X2 n=1 Tax=Armigeres subalbatus TaxID=124917 RepID=UPI002ED0E44D
MKCVVPSCRKWEICYPKTALQLLQCTQEANIKQQNLLENALRHTRIESDESNASNFRLKRFPHVCRMCLKPNSNQSLMISLSTVDPVMGGKSIHDFIEDIMAPIMTFDQNKQQFLPQSICQLCLELLRFFARYYSKMTTLHLFMNSLIEVKHRNFDPIVDLFDTKSEHLRVLIKDLDLCSLDKYSMDDLLEEFPTYELASFDGFVEEESKDIEYQEPAEESTSEAEHHQPDSIVTDVPDEVPLKGKKRKRRIPTKPKEPEKKLEEALQCDKCPYSSYSKRCFQTHKLVHDLRKPKTCVCQKPGCSEVFQSRIEYRRHVQVAHKAYVCETCGLRCVSRFYLKNHMARHLKKYEHLCPYCKQGHNTNGDLLIHIRVMHLGVYSYRCDTCGMTFRKKATRDEHQLAHSEVYAYECLQCDKKFKKQQFLKNHITKVHDKVRLHCPHCTEHFGASYNLNNHIEKAHGIQVRFICDVCVQTFTSQDKLDRHRERHDKPHELECSTCLTLVASKEMLADHLCITYKDDYVCCGRDHRYHTMYNKHMLLKHDIRMNARVKPIPGKLMGEIRAKRKRVEMCMKCEKVFPTRALKKQHTEICHAEIEVLEDNGDDVEH